MKIGQKIKCINSNDSESLNRGSTYEVTDINQYNNIQVKPLGGQPLQHYYKQNRFELVKDSSKIDIAKKYRTRDGKEVKLFVISDDPSYPVVGQIFEDGEWRNESWTEYGGFIDGEEGNFDLVEVPQEVSFEFENRNIKIKISKNLTVKIYSMYDYLSATIHPEVMDRLIEEYQKMKQCNS